MACVHWLSLLLCLLFTFLQDASGDFERRCGLDDRLRSPAGICGRHLSQALGLLCNHSYQKRALSNTIAEWSKHSAEEQAWNDKVFLPKTKATSLLQHKRSVYNDASNYGNGVGIVCECCVHKCSLSEMAQYCRGNVDLSLLGKRSWDSAKSLPPSTMTWKPSGSAGEDKSGKQEVNTSDNNNNSNNKEIVPQSLVEDMAMAHVQETGNGATGGQSLEGGKLQKGDVDKQITELILLKMFPEKKV